MFYPFYRNLFGEGRTAYQIEKSEGVMFRQFLFAALLILTAGRNLSANQISLSLEKAIEIAVLESGSEKIQLVQEMMTQADAEKNISRAALLPNIKGEIGQSRQTINTWAMGLGSIPGFRPPKLVGPFSTFDARGEVVQQIFNLSSIRQYQASRAALEGASVEADRVRDEVAAGAAQAYLEALAARNSLETAQSGVRLAREILALTRRQKEAGTGTRIEVTRAEVQLAEQTQRELSEGSRLRRAKLRLLRAVGLDLDLDVLLTAQWGRLLDETEPLELLIETAIQNRSDLKAQQHRERSAELSYASAKAERMPSLAGFANYGSSGNRIDDNIPTWAVGISLDIPIYNGGLINAKKAMLGSRLRQEQIRTRDLQRQIELEVRLAYENERISGEQVRVAGKQAELAKAELEQARRRYRAGVATSLELSSAQTRLQQAEEAQVQALRAYYVSRIELLKAVGTLRTAKIM